MVVDVLTEIVIDRPRGTVAAYASDPLNVPSWQTNIKSADLKTLPPVRVGSRVEFSAKFLGRNLVYTYDFTEFVPGERLVMQTPEGGTRWVTTYTWESVDGDKRTRMTLRNWGEPGALANVATPLLKRSMRGAAAKSLLRLKAILEQASTSA